MGGRAKRIKNRLLGNRKHTNTRSRVPGHATIERARDLRHYPPPFPPPQGGRGQRIGGARHRSRPYIHYRKKK